MAAFTNLDSDEVFENEAVFAQEETKDMNRSMVSEEAINNNEDYEISAEVKL